MSETYVLNTTSPEQVVALTQGQCITWVGNTPVSISYELPGQGTQTATINDGGVFCAPITADFTFKLEMIGCPNQPSGTVIVDLSSLGIPVTPVDGVTYQAITVCDASTSTLWVQWNAVENGVVTVLQDWVDTGRQCNPDEQPICDQYIGDAMGDDVSELEAGNYFVIKKPTCCELTVTTSAGSFTLKKGEVGFESSIFDCPVTIDSIVGDCLAQTHVIIQRK